MPRAVTREEMREIDRVAIEEFGVPSVALMESAGRAVADAVAELLPEGGFVIILVGKGNNGGDGWVAARRLHGRGYGVEIYEAAGAPAGDAALFRAVVERMALPIAPADAALAERLLSADAVVDALLGTGLSGEVRDAMAELIGAVNAAGAAGVPVVAVDTPSGLDCNDGRELGACVRAHTTVSFALPKRGFERGAGPACAGRVVVADIGIPPEAVDDVLGPGA
ncbi:MAG: NAD(P)H-hydrate epimerase [Planctomycetota bacterium]|jgi:NAD(P)H-hydrate epimerase